MLDENAFGLLISYFNLEDDEYSLEPDEFASRLSAFGTEIRAFIANCPPGTGATALDFGHAVYLELADGEQLIGPITWLRQAREHLREKVEVATVAILSHGGRWVEESQCLPATELLGELPIIRVANSSEPLRRALYAETAAHGQETSEHPGWGPGLYLDTEAVEALSLRLKNAPTPLEISEATFYRAGS